MTKLLVAIVGVTAMIFVVPVAVYGVFQSVVGAAMPQGAEPMLF